MGRVVAALTLTGAASGVPTAENTERAEVVNRATSHLKGAQR